MLRECQALTLMYLIRGVLWSRGGGGGDSQVPIPLDPLPTRDISRMASSAIGSDRSSFLVKFCELDPQSSMRCIWFPRMSGINGLVHLTFQKSSVLEVVLGVWDSSALVVQISCRMATREFIGRGCMIPIDWVWPPSFLQTLKQTFIITSESLLDCTIVVRKVWTGQESK